MAGEFKKYLISFQATLQGKEIVLSSLKQMEHQMVKGTKVTEKGSKSTKSFSENLNDLAKRAMLTIPIWLLLRGAFMTVLRTITDSIQAFKDLDDQLARIRTVMHGNGQVIEAQMVAIRSQILETATNSRIPLKELAEGFYFLKTSNLDAKEAMEAFDVTVSLAVGTNNKMAESARAVAGIYNTMGDYLGDNLSVHEKFQKIADNLAYTYSCYTPDTEVLTDKGWKYFKDLDKTEKVATLNPKTNEIEYQKPREYVEKFFEGKLYHVKGRFIDIKVTPTHKLYTKLGYKPKKQEYGLVEARNVFERPKSFYRGSNWIGENPEYFILPEIKNKTYPSKELKIPIKTWIKFLAWYLSEGCVTWLEKKDPTYRITIYQSKNSKYYDNLKKVIQSMPFKFNEFHRGFIINNKQLAKYLKQFGKSYEKYLPDFVKGLSKDLLRSFLTTYARGDGSFRKKSFMIATSSDKMKNDLTEIALKANYGCTYLLSKGSVRTIKGIKTKKITRNIWYLSFSERTEFLIYHKKNKYYAQKQNRQTSSVEEWIDYKGIVYCVEVPKYHTLFVRRNGKAVWCGNTQDVQLSELIQSYTKLAPYVTGLSDSFTELTTMLGFLNTRLLRGGRTGRLTGRAILQLTKNAEKLANQFGITFDPNKPLDLLGTIKQIHDVMGKTGKMTAQQGQAIQEVFATRAGVSIRLLLENFNKLQEQIQDAVLNADGFAKKMEQIRMGTVNAQLERMKNIFALLTTELVTGTYGTKNLAESIRLMVDTLGVLATVAKRTGQAIHFVTYNYGMLATAMDRIKPISWKDSIPGLGTIRQISRIKDAMSGIEFKSWRDVLKEQQQMTDAEMAKQKAIEDLQKKQMSLTEEAVNLYKDGEDKKAKAVEERIKETKKAINELMPAEIQYQNLLAKKEKARAETDKVRVGFIDKYNQETKHQIALMKDLGVNSLDIARYELERLEAMEMIADEQEHELDMLKARNEVIEEEYKYRKQIVNTLQSAELDMLRVMGASELQILDIKERQLETERKLIGDSAYLAQLAQLRTEREIALQREKLKELDTATDIYLAYEKADKFEKEKLRRLTELMSFTPDLLAERFKNVTADRSVILQYWNYFTEQAQRAMGETIRSMRHLRSIDIPSPTVPDVRKKFLTGNIKEQLGKLQIVPTVGEINVNLPEGSLDNMAEEVGKQVTDKLKTDSVLQKTLAKLLRPYI